MSAPVDVLAVMAPAPHQITSPSEWTYVRRTLQPVEQEVEFGAVDGAPKATKLQECRIFEQVFSYLDKEGKDPPPQAIVDATKLEEARAAVAELIEAAKQASATLGHAYHTTLTGKLAEYAHADYQRLDAALARVRGSE